MFCSSLCIFKYVRTAPEERVRSKWGVPYMMSCPRLNIYFIYINFKCEIFVSKFKRRRTMGPSKHKSLHAIWQLPKPLTIHLMYGSVSRRVKTYINPPNIYTYLFFSSPAEQVVSKSAISQTLFLPKYVLELCKPNRMCCFLFSEAHLHIPTTTLIISSPAEQALSKYIISQTLLLPPYNSKYYSHKRCAVFSLFWSTIIYIHICLFKKHHDT